MDELIHALQRNPFFMPSGFTPQEKINILENKPTVKRVEKEIKARKREERKLHNEVKHKVTWSDDLSRAEQMPGVTRKVNKMDKTTKQIQYGFDLAKWWMMQHE